jgi:hypothetical protein
MPTTITSSGIIFNDTTSITSANVFIAKPATATAGQFLTFSGVTSAWVAGAAPTGSGGAPVEVFQNVNAGAATIDTAAAALFRVTLNANTTFTFTNAPQSPKVGSFLLHTIGDGTPRTIVWPSSVRWPGLTPVVSWVTGKVDTYSFLTTDAGATWFAYVVYQNQ